MATVHKRGGRWRAQVRRDGKSISQTFAGKAEALRWARQMETDFDRARATPAGLRITFGALVDTYLEEMRGKRIGATKLWVIERLRRSFAPLRLEEIDKRAILNHAQARENEGAGPATILFDLGYLRTVLKFGGAMSDAEDATALACVQLDAARAVLAHSGRIGPSRSRDRRPTDEELAQLAAFWAARPKSTTPMWDLTLFAISTCLRLGEIVGPGGVTWADLDEENRTLLVRDRKDPKAVESNDGVIPLLRGPVAISTQIIDPLEIIQRQSTRGSKVFPFYEQSISTAFLLACRACNIKNLHFHDLRHDGISRLFEAGYSIPEVAVVSGHKSWKHLQRYTNIRATSLHR